MGLTCCPEIKLNRDQYYEFEKDIEIETKRYRYVVLDVRKSIRGFAKDGSGRIRYNLITANFFGFLTTLFERTAFTGITVGGSSSVRGMDKFFCPYRALAKNEPVVCTFTSQTFSGFSTFSISVSFRAGTNYRELLIQTTPSIDYQQIRISWDTYTPNIDFVCQCFSVSGRAGTPFTASIAYSPPWTRILPMYHWMCSNNSQLQLQDIYGNTFVPRLTTPQTVSASEIAIDVSNQTSNSEDLYLVSPIVLTTARSLSASNSAPSWFTATSAFSPSSTMNVSAFGLVIPVYDTGGASRRVLLIRKNLEKPITVESSKPLLLSIRVYGL